MNGNAMLYFFNFGPSTSATGSMLYWQRVGLPLLESLHLACILDSCRHSILVTLAIGTSVLLASGAALPTRA